MRPVLFSLLLVGCAARQTPANQARLEGIVRTSDVTLTECAQPRGGCVAISCQLDNGRVVDQRGTLDIGVQVGTVRVTDGPQPMTLEPGDSEVHSEQYSLIGQSLAVCGTKETVPGLDVQAHIESCDDESIAHADCVRIDCTYSWAGDDEVTFEALTQVRLPRGGVYETWDSHTTTLSPDNPTRTRDYRFMEAYDGRPEFEIDTWESMASGEERQALYAITPYCEWSSTSL